MQHLMKNLYLENEEIRRMTKRTQLVTNPITWVGRIEEYDGQGNEQDPLPQCHHWERKIILTKRL